jgi:hypothetical protein
MKKYILIQNDGEIEPNSFELIGASTKRNDNTKIGFFGSGLKYSIAYMMRTGIDFKIFSGMHEFNFSTVPATIKDQQFDRICINGQPTSFTVSMGPTWKEDWFVLREIYCNALDEGTCTMVKETEIVQPVEGKTRIFIERTEALTAVCNDWDSYFAEDREPIFISEPVYTCYLGNTDNGVTSQRIKVYPKTSGIIFRKGVRVCKREKMMYDYGCDGVNINEDRTAANPEGIGYAVRNMFVAFSNEAYIKSILRTGGDETAPAEYHNLSYPDFSYNWSDKWIQFSYDNILVVKEVSARYAEEINTAKKEVFLIPSIFAKELKKHQPLVRIAGMGTVINDQTLNEITPTQKQNYLLKEVLRSLEEMKYPVPYEIRVAEFSDLKIMGLADINAKIIYISADTFDKGRREIAMTLMEETEHIKSQQGDETREFQTHIFSQWLKTMEESNGLFL